MQEMTEVEMYKRITLNMIWFNSYPELDFCCCRQNNMPPIVPLLYIELSWWHWCRGMLSACLHLLYLINKEFLILHCRSLAVFALNLICFAPQESSCRSINLMCTTATSLSPWHPWCLRWLLFVRKNIRLVTFFHMSKLCPIAAWPWPQKMAPTSSVLPKEPRLTMVQLWRSESNLKFVLAAV